MTNLRPFQIFILAIFGFLAILSVVILSNFQSKVSSKQSTYGERVIIWGVLNESVFRSAFQDISDTDNAFKAVSYTQIDERKFNDTLVSAIAEGRGPDMIILSSSELVRQRNRLLALSYDMISQRDFKDRYIDGAEIFARTDGVYALPLYVDPLVLYWNRDLFASAGLAQAPETWEYVVNYAVPNLTIRDNKRNILRASLPFGEMENVRNAKEIILTLTMQSGSKMITEENDRYEVALNSSISGSSLPPFEAATQFFLNFSNPNSSLYTWNRSQPMDRNAFVAGDLAMYVGFGSEMNDIIRQNPNLNFDIAQIPQGATATVRRTFGEFYGLAILKSSGNPSGAYAAASLIASPSIAGGMAASLGLAPVSRSELAQAGGDPFRVILYGAALTARTWLDPNKEATNTIFVSLIEGVSSGRDSLNRLIADTEQKIRLAF